MARPGLPLGRLLPAALIRAAPGLAVLGVVAAAGWLAPLWAALGAIACVVIAALMAVPAARDLAALRAYGIALAREGEAEPPALSGWAPAPELAATMGRIARLAARRRVPQGNVFEALPQPLLLLDGDREIVAVNGDARALIGGAPVGNDLAMAFRDPDVLEAADAVRAGGGARSVDFTVPGEVDRYYAAEIVPFAQPTAEGATMLMALYDLTEHRRAQQMRADFVANASHELRTPLATLIGFIETLRGPARDDAEAREKFLGLMQEEASRMARLVKDLLSLSKIEMEEHTAPKTPVDLGRIGATVAAALQMAAQSKDMKIVVRSDDDAPQATGDPDQLAQLLQNLIDNAIKYGRAGTEIAVHIFRRDPPPAALGLPADAPPAAAVAVTNLGEGIAEEHIPRLTERFYRVDAARSRAVGGTGLGLAIVKHIVTRHRGALEIASRPGEATTFTVTLPTLGPARATP